MHKYKFEHGSLIGEEQQMFEELIIFQTRFTYLLSISSILFEAISLYLNFDYL